MNTVAYESQLCPIQFTISFWVCNVSSFICICFSVGYKMWSVFLLALCLMVFSVCFSIFVEFFSLFRISHFTLFEIPFFRAHKSCQLSIGQFGCLVSFDNNKSFVQFESCHKIAIDWKPFDLYWPFMQSKAFVVLP